MDYVSLCHTLAPNVSLDFSVASGNALMLKWNVSLASNVPDWTVFVHDAHEMVLLDTYSMQSMPSLKFRINQDDQMASVKKVRISTNQY